MLDLLDTSDFVPRWVCGSWPPTLGWLVILSDLAIWGAYLAIPCVLVYFASRKRNLPFRLIFALFGAFILACGTTHMLEAVTFWWPVYRLTAAVKLLTAVVSWATVMALIPITPRALAMRSPAELEREVEARQHAESTLAAANADLERRVQERTLELQAEVESRKQAEAKLREVDQRKDEFLATLAHELRNPLAPIRNGLELLRFTNTDNAEIASLQGMLDRQVTQLVRLVDDLLDVSRISRGKIALRRQAIDAAAVVEAAVEMSGPHLQAAGHDLQVDLPTEPLFLDADPTRLTQVLTNLLNNASKYTDPGGAIRVQVRRDGDSAVLSVADNGIGIAPEQLPRVFEMFSQAVPALDRASGGLGIGLSLVKGLVTLHGGTVTAHSEGPGKGSEFTIRLPAITPPVAGPREEPVRRERIRRRVLIVDDNPDAANSLMMLLSALGHDVRTAFDGVEGVAIAEAFRPELVFLDLGMPHLNGYEAAQRIRAQAWGREMVLAALTGWGQLEDRQRSAEAGFRYHFVKPVDLADLERALAELPDSSR